MIYRLAAEKTLTDDKLMEFIRKHDAECAFRLQKLWDAYMTDYPIFTKRKNLRGSRTTELLSILQNTLSIR